MKLPINPLAPCALFLGARCLGIVIYLMSGISVLQVQAAEPDDLQRLMDRAEIEELATRYITALDTLDADMYVSVFTEDAVYDIEGQIVEGHDELRAIITGLLDGRARAEAEGRPVVNLYHTNVNPSVDILNGTEARYTAYWQTLRLGDDNAMRVGGMGRIEDEVVKINGQWKIRTRVLTNFVPRN